MQMRLQRLWRFLAEIFARLNEIKSVAPLLTREEIQDLQQLQLIVKIVFEPKKHGTEVSVLADKAVASLKRRAKLVFPNPAPLGQKLGTDVRQVFQT